MAAAPSHDSPIPREELEDHIVASYRKPQVPYEIAGQKTSCYVIDPLREPHQQTFILLHGSGDSGSMFGGKLMLTSMAETEPELGPSVAASHSTGSTAAVSPPSQTLETLGQVFPHARFVFPSAILRTPARYAEMPRGSELRQMAVPLTRWFDWWSLEEPELRPDVGNEGLRDSGLALQSLIRAEADRVPGGMDSIVFGGLSNGAGQALAMTLLMSESGDENDQNEDSSSGHGSKRMKGLPAAVVSMCGWLPYAPAIEVNLDNDGNGKDGSGPNRERRVRWLQRKIGWETKLTTKITKTASKDDAILEEMRFGTKLPPIFLGHGDDDSVVPCVRMDDATRVLDKLGFGKKMKTTVYPGLGHWYSPEMLRDLALWLQREVPAFSG